MVAGHFQFKHWPELLASAPAPRRAGPVLKSQTRRISMRTSEAFVLGAIIGAAAVWLWGRKMEEYVQEKTRGVRMKAAEGVREVEEKTGKVLDRGGDALRRADEFLQDTKVQVSEALRAGQEAIRPAPEGKKP
jgi:gas vesicle protein